VSRSSNVCHSLLGQNGAILLSAVLGFVVQVTNCKMLKSKKQYLMSNN